MCIRDRTVAGRGNDAWSHYTKILPSYVEEKYQTLHKVEDVYKRQTHSFVLLKYRVKQ